MARKPGKEETPTAARCLATLMLHHAPEVRSAAAAAAQEVSATGICFADQLLAAVQECEAAPPFGIMLVDAAMAAEDGGGALTALGLSERLLRALLAISAHTAAKQGSAGCPVNKLYGTYVARLLLATHHPRVLGMRHDIHAPWRSVRRTFPGHGAALASALAADAREAVAVLMGPAGMHSTSTAEQIAATAALGALMSEAGKACFAAVIEELAQLVDRTKHDMLSADDIKIFQTPEGAQSYRDMVWDSRACKMLAICYSWHKKLHMA